MKTLAMLTVLLDFTEMEHNVLDVQKDALNVHRLASALNATLNMFYTELNVEGHVLSTLERMKIDTAKSVMMTTVYHVMKIETLVLTVNSHIRYTKENAF